MQGASVSCTVTSYVSSGVQVLPQGRGHSWIFVGPAERAGGQSQAAALPTRPMSADRGPPLPSGAGPVTAAGQLMGFRGELGTGRALHTEPARGVSPRGSSGLDPCSAEMLLPKWRGLHAAARKTGTVPVHPWAAEGFIPNIRI